MKTKTLSILFALVMILSVSVGVFAQDSDSYFDQTWDEETVLQIFSEMDIIFPDMFAAEDSDYLWSTAEETGRVWDFPGSPNPIAKDVTLADVEAKAPIKDGTITKASFDPCGDGLIKFEGVINRDNTDVTPDPATGAQYGPKKYSYIKKITPTVKVNGTEVAASMKKCSSAGNNDCHLVKYNSNGEGKISGYIYTEAILKSTDSVDITLTVTYSNYMTALWPVPEATATITGTGFTASKKDYCQSTLEEYKMAGLDSVRAKYDQNTGEARFQATIRNFGGDSKGNYVIPAEVRAAGKNYTSYTCKYTLYNTANGAPRTDYCKFGEGIALAENGVIRFDITLNLSMDTLRNATYADGADIPFTFRVGGLLNRVGTLAAGYKNSAGTTVANPVFQAVDFPCPITSQMKVMDPLRPFMFFYPNMFGEKTISASGAYGVYKDGVWGMYQKCGKYAYMMVRLKNDGLKDEVINLKKTAVAINGGTPMSWNWVLTTVEADNNKITLEPGKLVTLIGRAKVTDIPSQLNADTAMTGAVNFTDLGFYITGSIYSDHNNTRCVAAPK